MSIKTLMKEGKLPNPYEIKPSDFGKALDHLYFGSVLKSDVGRLVYLKEDFLTMESVEQAEKRKGGR